MKTLAIGTDIGLGVRIGLGVGLGLAVACSAVSSPAPFEGPMVVPCDVESVYVFRSGEARLVSGDGSEVRYALPELGGRPACVAWDFAEGYGVAAYAEGLARITLEEAQRPEVLPAEPWAKTPASIGMAGGLMAVLAGSGSGTTLEMRSAEDGSRRWGSSLESWMDEHDLDTVAFALPVEEFDGDHFLLVAASGMRIVVQKIDRSTRPWREEGRTEFGELHRLQAWTSDGEDVYLAGVHERVSGASRQQMGTLNQTLLVYRFDARSLTKRELMRRENHSISTRVDSLSIASDLAALTLDGNRVEVYRVGADAFRQPALDRQQFPHAVRGICTSADSVVISGGKTPVCRSYAR